MNEKKDITINTSAFTITIHWNGPVVSAQFCILFGVMLLKWISKNQNVDTMCTMILILDFISILAVLFMGSSIGDEKSAEGEKSQTAPSPTAQPTNSEPPAEKGDKKNKKGSASEQNVKVSKKVPLPAQQGQQRPQQKTAPESVAEPVPNPEPVAEPTPSVTASQEELTEEALNDLFNW